MLDAVYSTKVSAIGGRRGTMYIGAVINLIRERAEQVNVHASF
jgi:hypothetical protein